MIKCLKQIIIISVFFLLVINISLANNPFEFNETFGNSLHGFSHNCGDVGDEGINYDNFLARTPIFEFNKTNNTWTCIGDGASNIANSSSFVNTIPSTTFNPSGSPSADQREQSIGHIFNIPIQFDNDSELKYYCQGSFFLEFGNSQETKFSLGLQSATTCSINDAPTNCCNFHPLTADCGSGNFNEVTFYNVTRDCGLSQEDLVNIEYVAVSNIVAGGGTSFFDDLYFTYDNFSNNLPYFNVSIDDNSIICLNKSDDVAEFNLTWELADTENNTILFASSSRTAGETINNTVDYNRFVGNVILGLDIEPNIDFLDNVVFRDGSCNVIGEEDVNYTTHYITTNTADGILEYMLFLNPICGGTDKYYYYDLGREFLGLAYYTEIYDHDVGNTHFNLSFFGSGFNTEVLRLKFYVNSTDDNMTIYLFDGSSETQVLKTDLPDNTNKEPLIINLVTDGFSSSILDIGYPTADCGFFPSISCDETYNSLGNVNITDFFNDTLQIRYVGIIPSGGAFIHQSKFGYSGIISERTYTSIVPETVRFTGFGSRSINIRVSDNVNSPKFYNDVDLSFSVVECSEFIDSPVGSQASRISRSLHTSICTLGNNIFYRLVPTLQPYRDKWYAVDFCLVLPLIYLFFTLVINIFIVAIIGFFKHSLRLPVFFINLGLQSLTANFLFVFSFEVNIIFILIFVMGIVMLLRNIFFGGGLEIDGG